MRELDEAYERRQAQLLVLHKSDPRVRLPPALAAAARSPEGKATRAIAEALGPYLKEFQARIDALEARVTALERDLERRQWLETQRRRREERERRG